MRIAIEPVRQADIVLLLTHHLEEMRTVSPPESVHALDLAGLSRPDITFWTVRNGGTLTAMGALRELDPRHGEIKSMHTAEAWRGRGLAARLLETMIATARERRYDRLSLETGATADFSAAHSLYLRYGFSDCPPFGSYPDHPFSRFMTRPIE